MLKFTSNLIKTDVTSVKIYKDYVLSGIGGFLHIHNIKTLKLLAKVLIFDGIKIYGIQINEASNKILFHGENCIKVFKIDLQQLAFNEIHSYECSDWILAAKWVDSDAHIATISMHNIVEKLSNTLKLIKSVVCEERCILYCACLSYTNWDDLVVFAGTVFSEVVLWKPKQNLNDYCEVLCRLKGHKGVLFSIHHNPNTNLIASTSDDRSVILWGIKNDLLAKPMDVIKIVLKCKMYGHTARVFGCKVLKNHLISIGEDGLVNIWDFNGELYRKLDTHQNGCVWVLDCDENANILITGGGDSGITKFPIKPEIALKSISLECDDVPKKIGLLKNNDFVVVTEMGRIYYHDKSVGFHLITQLVELKSYALLEVSKCRNLVAFAGFNGHIFIYKQINNTIKAILTYQTYVKTRIFSLHWLTCDCFVTCGLNGLLYLWHMHEKHKLILFHLMELPPNKERWSTCACVCDGRLIIGDRKGNLHLFALDTFKPLSTLKKAHNYLGITKLLYDDGEIISLGRNSTIKKYKLNANKTQLIATTSDKLPFTWLANLIQIQSIDTLLAFSGTNMILYDYKTRRILLEKNCGGGHRSWDFHASENSICFAFIKDKFINTIDTNATIFPHDITLGFNVNEINNLKTFKLNDNCDKMLIISGGEDTTLRLSTYEFKTNNFININILKSHLSSIRCLTLSKIASDNFLLFSAGGRAQIILWEICIKNEKIQCNELFSFYEEIDKNESEIRVMDLCALKNGGSTFLFAACSDGKVKIYLVSQKKLIYINYLQYKLKCIIKITLIECFNHFILVTMATDGFLVFWDLTELMHSYTKFIQINLDAIRSTKLNQIDPFHTIKMNQSGINSYSIKKLSSNAYIILTGGDDNALSLNYFKLIKNETQIIIKTLDNYTNFETHCAQITGAFITDKYFISAGLDQKLAIFKWRLESERIVCDFFGIYDTAIPDLKGIEVFVFTNHFKVVLYGLGIEILTIDHC